MQEKKLSEVNAGETILVIAVNAPEEQMKRLESIGIIPGTEIGVLAAHGGPLLVSVGDTRVAVERDLATLVIVA